MSQVARPRSPDTSPRPSGRWAVVLAGGEGRRLRALTRHLYGEERPKQYAALLGADSLLHQTLARVSRLVPPRRTVTVTLESHARYLEREVGYLHRTRLLSQPVDRGTAAGLLLPANWIHARDPDAVIAVFPADHFVGDDAAFIALVAEATRFIGGRPGSIVLLGVEPADPDPEYGWIEVGERVPWVGASALHRVVRFCEKPSPEEARRLFADGCLWNTLVVVAQAATFVRAAEECVPSVQERLARVPAFIGTAHESWAIRHAYALLPTLDFSRAILEATSVPLAVLKAADLTWSDLGTPGRVARIRRKLDITPPWREALEAIG
jgi:mannose-1-phosphate guanylyltransferase